ncbi:LysR family transcriptional regulator [Nonomuraea africana]|uniref:DNA-binding transcriptional LysR family regulator n=1 Tax=Nonomuraea africana TaxID=46171 RepID=A0ABR9KG77_9ACTN|nr:LysR family transcriptional regulator [Nonomuraea africana]MBE1560980.1 DNA-binding transcriptional LysR family regulator [Nonomuraea africana]
MRLFHEVAREGSFTAAAELLGYTQSAVSRRIAALEKEAGGPLFVRLARGVRLTPAGAALRRHAEAVLDRLDKAEEELAAIHRGGGGTLRIGAFATANVWLVPQALKAFKARRPEVELRLAEGLTGRLLDRLHAGALDVAVVSDYPAGLPVAAETVRLLEERLLVALPQGHRLADREVIDLRDLARETWIEAAPRGQPTILQAACARAGFTPRGGLRVAEWTGKFGYVAAGLGVTLVPELAARAVPDDVVLRPISEEGPRRTVYAALPEVPLPSALAFVELLGQ